MIYTLKSKKLTVEVDTLGAQIMSVSDGECEYIWQGNPTYWANRTPLMFPICGRFYDAKYTYAGKEYEMGTHGFARACNFEVESVTETTIVLSLTENEETLKQYPFAFKLVVSYTLEENKISSTATIINTDTKTLIATFGAHPGFNVPLDSGNFEDWYVEFPEDCTPNEVLQTPAGHALGKRAAYEISDSRKINLRHSLFDIDSIFLDHVPSSATLKSDKSSRSVTLNYPDMPFLGIWHKPQSDAPYVCIEPWCSFASYHEELAALETKADMFHILPSKSKSVNYEMIFN